MARILILEDNLVFAALLRASLTDEGHETVLCVDGSSALDAYLSESFDLVIADIIVQKEGVVVPDGGLSLIGKIQAHVLRGRSTVPIVAISGSVHKEGMEMMLLMAKDLGAHAVLAKPFPPHRLIELVDELLGTFS